jgi:iron complex outermembrane receptor protein
LILLAATQAHSEPPAEKSELDLFALDSQLEQQFVSSTKTEQRSAEAPAVITVITSDEIQARGYSSLSEVLRAVPGFYDVYDLVSHNIGVRGINGGARASGSVIKLMIDGHPVDYRPTTGNFFGEELIPLEAIKRVEVIRGPASALYGANAFLGVVNVITKSGVDVDGSFLFGRGALVREHPGGGGGAVISYASGPIDFLLSAQYLYLDRSGLSLPSTSPVMGLMRDALISRAPSEVDYSRPKTIYGKLSLRGFLPGTLTIAASVQNLDAHGEFQDFGPLTHGTRVSSINQNYRANYEVNVHPRVTLRLGGHYFNAMPSPYEKLDIGRPDYLLLRSVAAQGFGVNAETVIRAHKLFTLTIGADFVQEDHSLQTFDQKLLQDVLAPDGSVLRKAGSVIPGDKSGSHVLFRNVGVFAQGVLGFKHDLSATAGLRVDYHSLYGANASARAGLVYAPILQPLSLKLLYGSSFKAPSAEQLYTQPMKVLDILGNAQLAAQTAHTLEIAGAYRLPRERGEISVNLFATDVIGRVEYEQVGLFQQAINIQNEWVIGGELDSRFHLVRSLHVLLSASVARTVTKSDANPIATGIPQVTNPLFPAYQIHLRLDYALPWWGLRVAAEISYIGPRSASQSNALINGKAYDVPGYPFTALSISTANRVIIPHLQTSMALRVSDVINYRWIEPGFGGVDVPSQGITAFLTIVQQL